MIANGARPGDNSGRRDLFTEQTNTVLVFENGAVIRLSAAVAVGQLLFLTHKESRREVVAQVTRKRDFRPTNCYVEIEFSEPAPGFWGVEFSENPELLAATGQQKEAAELVQGSRIVSGKQSALAPAPSVEEVEKLKQEVEALHKQLRAMQTQTTTENPPQPPAPPIIPAPPPAPTAGAAPRQGSTKSPAARAQALTEFSSLSSRAAPPPVERQAATSSEEEPFPTPMIRVNRRKPAAERSPNPKRIPRGNLRPGVRRAAVLSLVLLTGAVGAAWYLDWIPRLKPPKKSAVQPASVTLARATSPVPQKTAVVAANSDKPLQAGVAAPLQPTLAPRDIVAPPAAAAKSSDPSVLEPAHSNNLGVRAADVAPKSVVTSAAATRVISRSSDKIAPIVSQSLSSDATVVPPKLIKSVRAVASPSALQYFDKSNTVTVTLHAVVDASGAVKSMRVVAGPGSLHKAAMDALKQYRYAPARRNGRRVAAPITVEIKFLFEP